ncbi:MAG TPA: peptide ABC transporter substrate-binding protein [Chlamydiales bacterium]|nr:peptide ABC transporter substrate-binding protein [Chlamydiales bacterium]
MKSFCLNFQKDPPTLDPRKCGDFISSAAIFLLYKGLTRLEANHQITYDIANSIYISQDGRTYEFHLGDCFWSDGHPITALDFENSWKTVLNPDFPALSAHLFYPIKNAEKAKKGLVPVKDVGIHAKSPKVLVVELEYPTPYFLELTGFCCFFPVPSHLPFSEEQCLSSGAFQLVHWKKGDEILLKKNEFSRNLYKVSLNEIKILITGDEQKALDLFEKGELDWIGDPISPLPIDAIPKLFQKRKVIPVGGLISCFFNTLQFPFHNRNMRKAFSFAINRKKILDKFLLPNTHIATSPVPPILKNNLSTDLFEDGRVDLAQSLFQKACQELKEKPSSLSLKLSFESSELGFKLAKELQEDWKNAFDISVKLEPLEFKALYGKLTSRDFSLSFSRWAAQYNDPMNILERFKFRENSKNFSGWENSDYIHLLNRYMKTPQVEKRLEVAMQAEKLLIEDMPIAPIYYFSYTYLQKPHVKNLAVSPIGVFHFDRVYLEKEQAGITG